MSIFKKGNKMTEHHEENTSCNCECCHCKKIFMVTVIVILAFIAGIMVGNCRQQYYSAMPYPIKSHFVKHKMHHRGNIQSSDTVQPNTAEAATNAELGGYIIEVEQAD